MDSSTCGQISKNSRCIRKVNKKVNKLKSQINNNNNNNNNKTFVSLFRSSTNDQIDVQGFIIYQNIKEDDDNLYDIVTGSVTINDSGRYMVVLNNVYIFNPFGSLGFLLNLLLILRLGNNL